MDKTQSAQEPTQELQSQSGIEIEKQSQELGAWANSVWEARAQPAQEPVAWMWKDMRGQDVVSLFEPRLNSIPLYIIPPMPAQETTTIHQFRSPRSVNWYDGFPDHHDGSGPYEVRTLYTTPPKREWEEWNAALDAAASRIGEIKGFGQATQDSFAVFIQGLKK